MRLSPLICGLWDGCGVWLQWTPIEPERKTDYDVQLRLRKDLDSPWGDWMSIVPRQGRKSHWAVIPTWREGWICEARVRVSQDQYGLWESASEVTFNKCTALFEFASDKYDQHFHAGDKFHCQVDAAACAYELKEEIEVKADEKVQARMEALGSSGYFQLDYPGHFEIKPSLGLRIYNVEPSQEDVTPTGRDFTEIKSKKSADMITMAVGTPNRF